MRILDRWTLGDPMDGNGQELWHGHLTEGTPISVQGPVRIGLYAPGRPLDFSTTALGVPIIHGKVKKLLEPRGLSSQMQLFPIIVEGQAEPYYLLNLLRVVRCIDDARCEEVAYRTVEDGYEDRIGEYRNVVGMRIDPSKVGDAEIFRPWGWQTNIIVSERVKRAMEESGMTGARFTEV
ncbi:imm11 family protein [Cystobacter ferrugineus]|uniref:Immunity MXAN-0049 protein domain-containing protein n=1 Tax=Cystobacter ferrugineus TaxID=83449 RepID=A0A1L9B9F4_9BACT|nr:DUF1629 domain-containing protein [Cystobacter ferrugineus]OJH38875.1 hypothetical protein BON30_21885 [Cystobacter ferrugineus]